MKRFVMKALVSTILSLVLVLELPMASLHADRTVYTTATGKKYHFDKSCRGLNNANSIYESSLSAAKASGLTACSICAYDTTGDSESSSSNTETIPPTRYIWKIPSTGVR